MKVVNVACLPAALLDVVSAQSLRGTGAWPSAVENAEAMNIELALPAGVDIADQKVWRMPGVKPIRTPI